MHGVGRARVKIHMAGWGKKARKSIYKLIPRQRVYKCLWLEGMVSQWKLVLAASTPFCGRINIQHFNQICPAPPPQVANFCGRGKGCFLRGGAGQTFSLPVPGQLGGVCIPDLLAKFIPLLALPCPLVGHTLLFDV